MLGKRDRYKGPFVTEKLVGLIDMLAREEMSFCEVEVGRFRLTSDGVRKGHRTRIRAGERLVTRVVQWQLTSRDFGLHPDEEVIVLKGPKGTGIWDKAPWVQYMETPRTIEMRLQVRRINQWLEAASIDYYGGRADVDPMQRRLKRLFNGGQFDLHGRLYGGWWQNLSSSERLEDVYIGDSPVVELDYGQMNVRLLYAYVGARPDFDDAYAIPGLEQHRDGVKKLLNAMVASSAPLRRFPKARAARCSLRWASTASSRPSASSTRRSASTSIPAWPWGSCFAKAKS